MSERHRARISSRLKVLTWLTYPGSDLSLLSREILLAQLISSPLAVVMGTVNGLLVLGVGLARHPGAGLEIVAALEVIVLALRMWVGADIARLQRRKEIPEIDNAILLSVLWCAVQGALGLVAMATGDPPVMVLAATFIMGIIGPICARNYSAPRLTMLMVCLCDLPFVAGGLLSGEGWLWVMIPMTPAFLLGVTQVIMTFNRVLVSALTSEARSDFVARHDSLTGLLNRQGLDAALEEIPAAEDSMVAILCADLDGFKQINDSLGHGVGDELLKQVGARLAQNSRPGDLVARIGGDEFLIVVRNLPLEAIPRITDRLISSVAAEPFSIGQNSVRVGASIGYACFPPDADSIQDLRLRADAALYAAKRAGKGVSKRCGEPDLATNAGTVAGSIPDVYLATTERVPMCA